jgi:hypothetical protein
MSTISTLIRDGLANQNRELLSLAIKLLRVILINKSKSIVIEASVVDLLLEYQQKRIMTNEVVKLIGAIDHSKIDWSLLNENYRTSITCLDILLELEEFEDLSQLARLLMHDNVSIRLKALRVLWYFVFM